MTTEFPIRVRETGSYALAQEWELVLITQGLAPTVQQSLDGFVLSVPEHELESARATLAAYDRENPPRVAPQSEPVPPINLYWGAFVGMLMLLFFLITTLKSPAMPWFERGSADAEPILRGELWRTVTALTLHANFVHVLSNSVAAVIFLSAVYGMLGVGLGSLLVLLAGAGGNLLNALMHGVAHNSVGASTGIFGAVGMLGVLGVSRQRGRGVVKRRAWLPIAAALALLAVLGTAGQRVDVFAHLFGFIVGALLAWVVGLIAPSLPGVTVQLVCGAAALTTIVYCWILALG